MMWVNLIFFSLLSTFLFKCDNVSLHCPECNLTAEEHCWRLFIRLHADYNGIIVLFNIYSRICPFTYFLVLQLHPVHPHLPLINHLLLMLQGNVYNYVLSIAIGMNLYPHSLFFT